MTEVAVTTDTGSDVTETQVSEFFESGGEKTPEVAVEKTTGDVTQETKVEEVKPDPIAIELKNIKGALAEERGKRKTEAQKREQMETRFQQLVERLAVPQQAVPAFEENPAAHLQGKVQELEQEIRQGKETAQQAEQRRQYESQIQALDTAYRTHAMQFAQQEPGFNDAYQHLVTTRQKAYENAGIDPAEYGHRLQADERQLAHTAFTMGVNPGALVYSLAQAAGWKPKAQTGVKQPNIDALQKGTQAKSLSGVAGKPQQNMTLEALAEMDDADFEKNWDKLIKG